MRTVARLAGAVAVFVVVRNTVASVLSVVLLVMLVLVCLLRGLALIIWLRARVVCARLLMVLASLLLLVVVALCKLRVCGGCVPAAVQYLGRLSVYVRLMLPHRGLSAAVLTGARACYDG